MSKAAGMAEGRLLAWISGSQKGAMLRVYVRARSNAKGMNLEV
jgi:hypothetical protein